MGNNNFNKAELLYNIAVAHEIPMESPDDVTLSIQNMLAEIRQLGHEEFNYLADLKLRKIKSPSIMKVLLKYYKEMDTFTRSDLICRIDPKIFPEVVQIAKEEFNKLGPADRRFLTGFQTALSKAKITDAYFDEMFVLLNDGENYAYLSELRKKFCMKMPHRMLPLIDKYSNGVLIRCAIQDIKYIKQSEDVLRKLQDLVCITEDRIEMLKSPQNNQELSVTTYEHYRSLCTVKDIRREATLALKKLKQNS